MAPKSFSLSVRQFADRTTAQMRDVFAESVQDVVEMAQLPKARGGRMPVDTGALRNSLASGLNGSFANEGADSYVVTLSGVQIGECRAVRVDNALRPQIGAGLLRNRQPGPPIRAARQLLRWRRRRAVPAARRILGGKGEDMILETDIENALKAIIGGAGLSWPVAWPNQNAPGAKPYIVFGIVRVNRRDDTHEGVMTISRGQLLLTVVMGEGISTKTANEKADQIAALFPTGRRLPVMGGQIVILKPADILEGFPQDGDWRVPVRVDYEAS
ncbi:phage tail terminator-like protein [Rhizobium halophilum]|uniref:phage tail terminator-like protein n=1 Tax=Rhizobium halophilum TaxID=2846852 RepID=UPI001EFD09E0|nr:phage tail terminator-like protein [Rhizobium halophilum]MCF6371050.1 DUF4128 domain-containing protein [Rhizobium halophilum]